MAKNKIEYNEISKAKVSETRNIVISNCSRGGFTIAQQLVATEEGKTTTVFLKGAFHVDDLNGLYELRDAINMAIQETEQNGDDSEDWDDAQVKAD
ncbi:MAG: hypothetical protein KBT03_03490 [Bacteroidales bacterium]|nr:hypothetical protein [Candidatus Scybalousia scybalohippi]